MKNSILLPQWKTSITPLNVFDRLSKVLDTTFFLTLSNTCGTQLYQELNLAKAKVKFQPTVSSSRSGWLGALIAD